MQVGTNAVLDWVSSHFKFVGGGAILGFFYKATRLISRVQNRFENVENTLTKVATNELPHIYAELQDANTSLKVLTVTNENILQALLARKD